MKFNSRLKWCKFIGRKLFIFYSKFINMYKLDVVVIFINLYCSIGVNFVIWMFVYFFLLNEVFYFELLDKLNNRYGEYLNSNLIYYLNK